MLNQKSIRLSVLWENIPGSQLCGLPCCAHGAHAEKPDLFNKVICDFLIEHTAARAPPWRFQSSWLWLKYSTVQLACIVASTGEDEAGSRITDPNAGPLFSDQHSDDDLASGTIYVLRSKSDNPVVAQNRDIVHKIGVTGGDVDKRIVNAKLDPTFLLADVEIVATYELYNINRTKLENLIHRIFDPARLNIEIKDRFGHPVVPREWFLVPLNAIDDAVDKIKDGTIAHYIYDPKTARLGRVD